MLPRPFSRSLSLLALFIFHFLSFVRRFFRRRIKSFDEFANERKKRRSFRSSFNGIDMAAFASRQTATSQPQDRSLETIEPLLIYHLARMQRIPREINYRRWPGPGNSGRQVIHRRICSAATYLTPGSILVPTLPSRRVATHSEKITCSR